jgi:hypothetical protein
VTFMTMYQFCRSLTQFSCLPGRILHCYMSPQLNLWPHLSHWKLVLHTCDERANNKRSQEGQWRHAVRRQACHAPAVLDSCCKLRPAPLACENSV